ncbi:hypothetical protein Acsp06_09400 [Actinomycetospora sp. NBRC 106375]|uniref:DUF3592 domain-containing protein n=1 Tax=Actinomycetospora sp. NBRC 106375 TaxID=3032207 RepID=UPI0024A0121E|nr:DUF3592 domain-containing protein [Actinomycetospora sp. NBRC 106375]GLZ44755.1 hypothetical protein Acsp06_09400 [Actinomycetospora sp. NBRC 106375]
MRWLRELVRQARERVVPVLVAAREIVRPAGRRAPEIVVVAGLVVTVLLGLVLVAAARNDAHIDANEGRAVAEVLEGGSRPHTFVRFTADDGAVLTPEKGVFYPRGLQPGQLVRVEYDRTDPELVRVAGRTWSEGLVPVALGLVVLWAVLAPSAWLLARARRRRRDAEARARWQGSPVPPGAGSSDEREDGEPEMAGAGSR